MYRQQGLTTLLVTTMVLVVSLIFSLASYKNVFYQIKRTQNEVLARKSHWLAEGGLECAFTQVSILKDVGLAKLYLPDNCKKPLNLNALEINGIGPYSIVASSKIDVAKRVLTKGFTLGSGHSGALKSSSDIYFNGAYTFLPDPGVKDTSNGWQCTALRYKSTLGVFGSLVNQGLDDSNLPYKNFPKGQKCASSYQSTVTTGEWSGSLGSNVKDFVRDTNFDPFRDVFFTSRKNWKKIKQREDVKKLSGSIVKTTTGNVKYQRLVKCGEKIAGAIKNNHDLIWVEGTCELNESGDNNDFNLIDKAINGNSKIDGVILVIQDGIFSVRGAHKFPGMIYHLNTSFVPSEHIWKDMQSHKNLPIPAAVPLNKASYYQSGSFMPTGGYVMDAPKQFAVFSSGMNFIYNKDIISKPQEKFFKASWIEGTWHDF